MADAGERFEQVDIQGSTIQVSNSVGTTPISIPDPAQAPISEFLIQCPENQNIDNRLLISMNGTDFITIYPSGHFAWTPKGETVTQLTLKGNQAGVLFEAVLNLEVI